MHVLSAILLTALAVKVLRGGNNGKTGKWRYFSPEDFDDPTKPGTGKLMQASTIRKLNKAQDILGEEVDLKKYLTSGYRTVTHNIDVGGVLDSAHLPGYGADFNFPGAFNMMIQQKVAKAMVEAGFKRFGVGVTLLHVDDDPTKDNAIWGYPYPGGHPRFDPFELT